MIPLKMIYAALALAGLSLGVAIASTSETPFITGMILGVILFGMGIGVKTFMETPTQPKQKRARRRAK
jgi:hypothetical protein